MLDYLKSFLGIFNIFFKIYVSILEYFKKKRWIKEGVKQEQLKQLEAENKFDKEVNQVLVDNRTKKEVESKLKDGSF